MGGPTHLWWGHPSAQPIKTPIYRESQKLQSVAENRRHNAVDQGLTCQMGVRGIMSLSFSKRQSSKVGSRLASQGYAGSGLLQALFREQFPPLKIGF